MERGSEREREGRREGEERGEGRGESEREGEEVPGGCGCTAWLSRVVSIHEEYDLIYYINNKDKVKEINTS